MSNKKKQIPKSPFTLDGSCKLKYSSKEKKMNSYLIFYLDLTK